MSLKKLICTMFILTLILSTNVLAAEVSPDPYEPNNTVDTAYPYAATTVLSGNEYINGYRNSNIHVEDDEDWFYITLSSSRTYDVILKNIYDSDIHIYIWKENSDGTWTKWRYANQKYAEPEHYTFTPPTSGKYYIQIAGFSEPESLYYFFAVEPVGKLKNLDLRYNGPYNK